jgi:hypothetical protein
VEISCRIYKPRRARESPLFRLVEQHLEELLRVWPARFVRQHGPLRPVVERVLRESTPVDGLDSLEPVGDSSPVRLHRPFRIRIR